MIEAIEAIFAETNPGTLERLAARLEASAEVARSRAAKLRGEPCEHTSDQSLLAVSRN